MDVEAILRHWNAGRGYEEPGYRQGFEAGVRYAADYASPAGEFATHAPYPTPADFDAMTDEEFWAYCDRIGATERIRRAMAEATE